MSIQFNRQRPRPWIVLFALAIFSLPLTLAALQHQPPPPVTDSTVDQPDVNVKGQLPAESTKGEIQENRQKPGTSERNETIPCGTTPAEEATGPDRTEVVYRLDEMFDHPDGYVGKTITVDGKMHRQFTDRVFTIEDEGFFRDRDMLVITLVPMSQSVVPLQGSFDQGKHVRVTGVLRPYDRGKLECLYGPLHLESREGHSFTKNPVLIIGHKEPPTPIAAVVQPPLIVESPPVAEPPAIKREKPAPAPEEAAQPAAPKEAPAATPAPAAPESLPKTAGNLPLVGLAGALFLFAACCVRLYTSTIRGK